MKQRDNLLHTGEDGVDAAGAGVQEIVDCQIGHKPLGWIVARWRGISVVLGLTVAVRLVRFANNVPQLRGEPRRSPRLPAGTTLVDETARDDEGDSPAYLERQCRLPSATDGDLDVPSLGGGSSLN
ncbi:MAG: hypothetical protein QOK02_3824 [Mycobacterium sp.]|nr:hypothetical protein [Mycobacterium sp.]